MDFITILLFLSILSLNYYLYKRKYLTKSLYIISNIFLIVYFMLSILIYYNNISDGFEHGIIFGDILGNHFCDEYRYYMDSNILLNHLKNGDFFTWLTGNLPDYEYIDPNGHPGFGNYNIFVIILTFLKLLGITNTLSLITIKLALYIPTSIFIYKIAKMYLSDKLSLLAVIIFSLLPGYSLINSLLMRDSIIIILTLILTYYVLQKRYNIFVIIPIAILLLFFRSYMLPIIIMTTAFCYKNAKTILSKNDFLYLLFIILLIIFFSRFNFNTEQMRMLQERFADMFGNNIFSSFIVCIYTVIHIFYDPLLINFLTSGVLYIQIFSLGNIIANISSILFIPSYFYSIIKYKNERIIYLLKYTFYYSFITGILVLSKDGYIINRIALQWLPLYIIIILLPFNKELNKK